MFLYFFLATLTRSGLKLKLQNYICSSQTCWLSSSFTMFILHSNRIGCIIMFIIIIFFIHTYVSGNNLIFIFLETIIRPKNFIQSFYLSSLFLLKHFISMVLVFKKVVFRLFVNRVKKNDLKTVKIRFRPHWFY